MRSSVITAASFLAPLVLGSSDGGSMYGDAAGTNCSDFEFEPSQCTAANGCKLDGTACLQADAPDVGGGSACVDAPDMSNVTEVPVDF